MEKEFIHPSSMGFTHTVGVTAGGAKTIYVSGQVGFADGKVPESIGEQADIAFTNLVSQANVHACSSRSHRQSRCW